MQTESYELIVNSCPVDKSVDYDPCRSIIIYCTDKDTDILKYGSVKPLNSEHTESPLKKRLIIRKNTITGFESGITTKSHSIKSIFLAIYHKWLFVFLMVSSLTYSLPVTASAGIVSVISDFFMRNSPKIEIQVTETNSQNVPLLQSAVNFDLNAAVGGADITVVGNEALVSESGPSGTLADISDSITTGQISKYIVRNGDSLGSIAKMYGVTTNTIVWANNLTSSSIKEGQSLIILPVSGTIHTIAKGDTLKSIAKKYKADAGEIAQFNGLDSESVLEVGETIIIPDGEGTLRISGAKSKRGTSSYRGGGGPEYPGYYISPLNSGIKTQGLHGYNGIDIGVRTGTTLYAAAAGQVIIARPSGWNGGYGKYIVISHYNGTQTVYGHLSQVFVNEGDLVYQGQVIGLTGNSGNSTGPHLHFEVRGAKNPLI